MTTTTPIADGRYALPPLTGDYRPITVAVAIDDPETGAHVYARVPYHHATFTARVDFPEEVTIQHTYTPEHASLHQVGRGFLRDLCCLAYGQTMLAPSYPYKAAPISGAALAVANLHRSRLTIAYLAFGNE